MLAPPARRQRIRASLRASMLDGIFANIMLGCTDQYLTPFAVALQASTQQVGLLNALKNLAASFPQLWATWLTERFGSRKRFMVFAVFWHAALWIPVMLVPFVLPRPWQVPALIGGVTCAALFGSIAAPPWGSLMADHVPERMRGRYFGWRNRIHGFVGLVSVFAAGVLLHAAQRWELVGFSALFLIASIARFISWSYLSRMYEPPLPPVKPEDRIHPLELFRLPARLRSSEAGGQPGNAFTPFVSFVALSLFAINLSAPFLAVYLLRDLRYSYLMFTIVNVMASLASFLTMTFWGRRADRYGNIKVLKACAIGIAVIPFLWMVSPSPYYLIGVQIYAGALWAGFNLTVVNFAYDAAAPQHRTSYIALVNAMNGLAMFGGALCGGWFAARLPSLRGSQMIPLFAISGVARLVVVAVCLQRLQEVRRVAKISTFEVLIPVFRGHTT